MPDRPPWDSLLPPYSSRNSLPNLYPIGHPTDQHDNTPFQPQADETLYLLSKQEIHAQRNSCPVPQATPAASYASGSGQQRGRRHHNQVSSGTQRAAARGGRNNDCLQFSGCSTCRDCVNCSRCSNCTDFVDCSDCSECKDCVSCSRCSKRRDCVNCRDCKDYIDCVGCIGFTGARNVIGQRRSRAPN